MAAFKIDRQLSIDQPTKCFLRVKPSAARIETYEPVNDYHDTIVILWFRELRGFNQLILDFLD